MIFSDNFALGVEESHSLLSMACLREAMVHQALHPPQLRSHLVPVQEAE